jgi:hypothetical protein
VVQCRVWKASATAFSKFLGSRRFATLSGSRAQKWSGQKSAAQISVNFIKNSHHFTAARPWRLFPRSALLIFMMVRIDVIDFSSIGLSLSFIRPGIFSIARSNIILFLSPTNDSAEYNGLQVPNRL